MKTIKQAKAPVRIDFAGGTTDIAPFTHTHGGAVLNAAINKYVYGKLIRTSKSTKLEYYADIPTSSGLGTSSAMNLVWLSLITKLKDKTKLAESVFKIEQAVKESSVNGKQDQYASAFGGINYMEFIKNKVKIHRLKLKKDFICELNEKLVIVYSGKAHYSGTSNNSAIQNFLQGKNTEYLIRLKKIAKEMKSALLRKDLDAFADLMNQETGERKQLSKTILSPQLKKIIEDGMKNQASAAKILGSGGGGSILFFTNYRKNLLKFFKEKVIDFQFDFQGLQIS